MTNKKKTSRQKRTLIGAVCVAAVIMAGSTFAWFTSKDEVTNRLSASANYNVTIAEDFTPPENWTPGQEVDKNVGVVNTGNVDAFVRTWLEGVMRLTVESRDVADWQGATTGGTSTPAGMYAGTTKVLGTDSVVSSIGLTATTDKTLSDLGLTYQFTTGSGNSAKTYFVKELNKTDMDTNPEVNGGGTSPNDYTEVMAVQAGGVLAYFDGTGTFTYTPNQTVDYVSEDGVHIVLEANQAYTVSAGSSMTDDVALNTNTKAITYRSMQDFVDGLGKYIDTNTFKPTTSGLYIFRRNVSATGTGNSQTDDFEFTGYYYVQDAATASATAGGGKYFALQYENDNSQRSDYVLEDDTYSYEYNYTTKKGEFTPSKSSKYVTLFTAEQKLLKTTDNSQDLHWVYTDASGDDAAYLTAVYAGATDGTADDIKIKVQLANTSATAPTSADGSAAESWTAIGTAYAAASGDDPATKGEWTFYYNNDLEEGATTKQLVDSLTLDKDTTQYAYIAFDFDLNVFMDSIQVSLDSNGNETVEPVKATAGWVSTASTTNTPEVGKAVVASGAKGNASGAEIEYITWTAVSGG